MKKLIRKIILFSIFLFFFFPTEKSTAGVLNQNTSSGIFADKKKTETESEKSSEKFFDKKSLFESEESVVFEKDDDILNAPPDLGEGTFPPGGQVNPDLPLEDSHFILLVLTLIYGITRLFFSFRKR